MAEITYGAVLALVRIFEESGIDSAWVDFMRAYGLRGESLVPRPLPYSGPSKYGTMKNLKDLHRRLGEPSVQMFFEHLAQATLNEFWQPRYDRLGRMWRLWGDAVDDDRPPDDILALLSELERGGYHLEDDGELVAEDAGPAGEDIDPIAQIPGRSHLDSEAARIFEKCRRAGVPVGALFIDIDNFKEFNDRHDHETGDEVLRAVAAVIARAVEFRGVVGRWGKGDDIVVTIANLEERELVALGERIRTEVERLKVKGLAVTVSVGAASIDSQSADPALLWRNADKAMQAGKATGKNRTTGFSEISPAS